MVKLLLETRNVDVDSKDKHSPKTPLLWAARGRTRSRGQAAASDGKGRRRLQGLV